MFQCLLRINEYPPDTEIPAAYPCFDKFENIPPLLKMEYFPPVSANHPEFENQNQYLAPADIVNSLFAMYPLPLLYFHGLSPALAVTDQFLFRA